MATSSYDIFTARRTLSGRMKRLLVTVGSAISAMFNLLLAEFGRAAAAARRYDELKRTGPVMLRPVEAASIPRAIFEEFYGDRIGWRL